MAHPLMFDDADPVLRHLRGLALALPDAAEKISHGRPAFYTTKVFAYYGGAVRTPGAYRQHPRSVMVLVDPDEREALLAGPHCYLPAYLGPYGWVGVDIAHEPGGADITDGDAEGHPDGVRTPGEGAGWDEIAELLDASYRLTAGSRRVTALDARKGEARPSGR